LAGTDPYRIRDFVPEFDAISAEFAARSREMSARTTIRADIPYGSRPREVLDLVLPGKPTRGVPLHIFVHGGYWRSGEKADYRLVAEPVLAAGGMAALVEYDLMPGQRLPILVDQVRRAARWLQDQAASFGADPRRITVSGHSAGAHLASYLAARGPQEDAAPKLPELKTMLLLSGIYDLSDIPTSFLRNEAEMTQEEAAAWSPLASSHMPAPKRILAFGEEETPPFHDQAKALHRQMVAEGLAAVLLPLPKANHMNVVLDLADPHGLLGGQIADLVSTV
jgi:arylformamidase